MAPTHVKIKPETQLHALNQESNLRPFCAWADILLINIGQGSSLIFYISPLTYPFWDPFWDISFLGYTNLRLFWYFPTGHWCSVYYILFIICFIWDVSIALSVSSLVFLFVVSYLLYILSIIVCFHFRYCKFISRTSFGSLKNSFHFSFHHVHVSFAFLKIVSIFIITALTFLFPNCIISEFIPID